MDNSVVIAGGGGVRRLNGNEKNKLSETNQNLNNFHHSAFIL